MEWTNAKVCELIELYRDRPVLWDCRLKEYKDRNKKQDALQEIADTFGVDKQVVEKKTKNVVCHFLREIKRERDSSKSGAGNSDVYKSVDGKPKSALPCWLCQPGIANNQPRHSVDAALEVAALVNTYVLAATQPPFAAQPFLPPNENNKLSNFVFQLYNVEGETPRAKLTLNIAEPKSSPPKAVLPIGAPKLKQPVPHLFPPNNNF
ncbi:hypothetical protein FQA39_LY12460 [Lamprigera yunnana]|nr:hypothetical protein FQA39_LY12460 [Lamprigera yunnana]